MRCRPTIPSHQANKPVSLELSRQQHYDDLMACAGQSSNNVWLAQIIASWRVGAGELPDFLGLPPMAFQQLLQQCFPHYHLPGTAVSGKTCDFSRMLEKQDLELYLRRHAAGDGECIEWLIGLIVTACLGSNHLWQDLGLWSREDLSDMLGNNFPELKVLNGRNMKWKKFLYKQLCEAEGIYVCRAPSCEVCKDYVHCFGPEE
ncbi:MAG: nitrogen fixation protein NifQ [Methylococcales bacterium]|nr:nitrogen fixation protein NifQ [Methylococcales bacterium]